MLPVLCLVNETQSHPDKYAQILEYSTAFIPEAGASLPVPAERWQLELFL